MVDPTVNVVTSARLRRAGWVTVALIAGSLRGGAAGSAPVTSLVWILDNVKLVGGHAPLVLGAPQVTAGAPLGEQLSTLLPSDPVGRHIRLRLMAHQAFGAQEKDV